MKNKAKNSEIIVDFTDEEYQVELAQGLQDDEVLTPGQYTFKRGGFLARHGIAQEQTAAPVKARISINLDLEVINYFKQRAAQPNAAPYQTQINNTLRQVMEQEQAEETSALSAQAEALLADPRFIDAVAERVQLRTASTGKRSRRAA